MTTENLLVYDASAGSGKTYNLSNLFCEFLIEEYRSYGKQKKDVYRNLMAVTFTNKATFEMKSRIIARLFKLSQDASYKYSDEAKEILKYLVHDYTMFKVSTIDSFFQRVLKSFALEMGSRSAYDTSLDSSSAIEAALDGLYSKLGTDDKVFKLMQDISLSRLDEGKNWNWRDSLLKTCKHILDSDFQNDKESVGDSKEVNAISVITSRLESQKKVFVSELIRLLDEIRNGFIDKGQGLDNIKYYGHGAQNSIYKLLKGNLSCLDRDAEIVTGWYNSKLDNWKEGERTEGGGWLLKRGNVDDVIIHRIENIIGDRVGQIVGLFNKHYKEYRTYYILSKNIRETALLEYVSKELDDYLSTHQLDLLCRAPQTLFELIDGSDTPFIYDKIGSEIEHYLLDEFQDTSVDQWKNFKPLLQEGMDRGKKSLLVGDVKQSIYRWRDGEWKLLKEDVPKKFSRDYLKKYLSTNFRSLSNIVDFNNLMFSTVDKAKLDEWKKEGDDNPDAYKILENADPGFLVQCYMANLDAKNNKGEYSPQIKDIYRLSAQRVCKEFKDAAENGKEGVVHIVSCPKVDKKTIVGVSDFILWDVALKIKQLVSSGLGYKLGDIAILTSSRKEASLIANYLVDRGIEIVSGESLMLDSNRVVSLILELLRKIVNPDSKGLDMMIRLSGLEIINNDCLDPLCENGIAFGTELRSSNSLYQVCKLLIRTFFTKIEKEDTSFVKAFLDRVLDYSSANGTSIPDFLKWWDLSKDNFFIPEPQSGNAVQIMTMHKAKGLAFKVVIIPFLRDDMISTIPSVKWLRSKEIGYDGPLLLNLSSKLERTFFEKDLNKERMELSVDSLNLAYVSFTRPKERLYIYAPNGGDVTKVSSALNSYLNNQNNNWPSFESSERFLNAEVILKEDPNMSIDDTKNDFSVTDYIWGKEDEVSYASTIASEQVEGMSVDIDISMLEEEPSKIKIRGVYDEDDNVRRGVLYHELFSYIDGEGNTEGKMDEKVAKAVDKFLKKNPGSLIGDDADSLEKEVLAMIARVKEKGYGWFDEGKRIYGEQSIISEEGKNFRPDRIVLPAEGEDGVEVVDYKFGEYKKDSKSDKKYHEQVRNYMNLLQEMGYSNVKGFLWYVLEDEVVPV